MYEAYKATKSLESYFKAALTATYQRPKSQTDSISLRHKIMAVFIRHTVMLPHILGTMLQPLSSTQPQWLHTFYCL